MRSPRAPEPITNAYIVGGSGYQGATEYFVGGVGGTGYDSDTQQLDHRVKPAPFLG